MRSLGHSIVGIELFGILVRLVEIAEPSDGHQVQTVVVYDIQFEVTHDEVGEVETRHLEQQLVLVERVGMVGEDKGEVGDAVGDEFPRLDGVTVVEHGGTTAPYVTEVELATMELAAFANALHNHTGHLADAALRVVLHHGVHVFHATVHVSLVQFAQTVDEDELVAVGAQGITTLGDARIARHLAVAVGLEGFVGGGIERVFHMHAKL